jgi:hypothetical protein
MLMAVAATLVCGELAAQAVPEDAQAAKVPMAYRRIPSVRVDPFRHLTIPHWGLVISGAGVASNNSMTFNDARALIFIADQDDLLVGDVLDALNKVPSGQGFEAGGELEGGLYLGGPFGRHFSLGVSAQGRSYGVSTLDEAAVALLREGNVARDSFPLGSTGAAAVGTEELGLHALVRFGPIGSADGLVLMLGGGARLLKPVFYYQGASSIDSRVIATGDSVAATVGIETLETPGDPDFALELGNSVVGDFMVRFEWPTSGLALEASVANVGSLSIDAVERRTWTYQVNSTRVQEVLDSLDSDPTTDGIQFRDLEIQDTVSTTVDIPTIWRFSGSAWANRILQLDASARLATSGQILEYPLEVELGTTWRLLRVVPLRVGLLLGGRQEVGFTAGLGIETRNLFFQVAARSAGGFIGDARGAAGLLQLGFFF